MHRAKAHPTSVEVSVAYDLTKLTVQWAQIRLAQREWLWMARMTETVKTRTMMMNKAMTLSIMRLMTQN